MRLCKRCVLPETFPGIRFDDEGVCIFCTRYKGEADDGSKKESIRRRFEELAAQVRSRAGYHCLLAYSGGKDSSYSLWLLREKYGLRVLAVTLDNGFASPQSFVNIRRVVEYVNADSMIVKPPIELLKRIFAGVAVDNPYPPKALERASSICNACIGLVKNVTLRVAIEKGIPLIAYGWSPGQAPISASLFRMNAVMLKQMHDARSAPLREIGGEAVAPYLLSDAHFGGGIELPYNVNLLAFHSYDEERVLEQIQQLGWSAPVDTDGNSTNCLLNSYANRVHLKQYGFHPYAFEVAGLVRSGAITRTTGLKSLADAGSDEMARQVASRLGIEIAW